MFVCLFVCLFQLTILAFAILLLNVISIPYLLLVVVPVVAMFLYIRQYYLKTSREVKRLEAASKSSAEIALCFLNFVFFRSVSQIHNDTHLVKHKGAL